VYAVRLLVIAESTPTTSPGHGNGSTLISAHLVANLPPDIHVDLVYFRDRAAEPDPAVVARADTIRVLTMRSRRLALLAQPFTRLPRASWQRRLHGRDLFAWSEPADVVYLHGMHVMAAAAGVQRPVVVHEVDPWSSYWSERASRGVGPRRAYDLVQSRRAARLERAAAAAGATLVVVNEADADALRRSTDGRVVALANGIELPDPTGEEGSVPADRVLTFVGSLDYPPNVEALSRFADEVWPHVRAALPDARMVVAGRRAGPAVLALADRGIEVLGEVPDVNAVFRGARASVYAGVTGRGTKNSVTESLMAGCPVVASPESARGQQPGPHLLVGADGPALAAHAIRLLVDTGAATEARRACCELRRRARDWATASGELADLLREVAGRSVSRP
jgi:polysaccharide biosynthesis protein PslH